jgi:uncharacterized protein
MTSVIADTGPLVAYLQRRDAQFEWTREAFDRLDAPFLTCEPVLTEACFLIARGGGDPDDLLELVERRLIRVRLHLAAEMPRLRALMKRYRKAPMSLADACLVRLSEQITNCQVVTFDHHFHIYRRHDRRPIPVLMPGPR